MDTILASASPRRADILRRLGLTFQIMPAAIDEQPQTDENGENLVQRLACEKAAFIAARFPHACVIAADTIICHENTILGKPPHAAAALTMLRALAGKTHHVFTGLAISWQGKSWQNVTKTAVTMIDYDEMLFRAYVASGEPLDKAGGYGIQGRGSILIRHIEGDFYNVVGLSVQSLRAGFSALGLESVLLASLKSENDHH